MENNEKQGSGVAKISNQDQERDLADGRRRDEENPAVADQAALNPAVASGAQPRQSSARTPFSDLSQVDADLALARTLQEQERAYMMIRMGSAVEESDNGSWETSSYVHEDDEFDVQDTDGDDGDEADEDGENEGDGSDDDEDAFDVHGEDAGDHNSSAELDAADFSSDEAYARALQDAEEREMAARLMALTGINGHDSEEEHGVNSQDGWEETDPDELSYEELIALGEVVGTESRGLSSDTISSLPSVNYKTGSNQSGSNDSCVICRLDYEDGEKLTLLSCKHSYHSECINNWLLINKVCPVCSAEVSTSGNG